jgi:hypothetical protein
MARVIWKLIYPIASDRHLTVCRLHLESLKQDPHVANLECHESPEKPQLEVTVTFREGHNRPFAQDLRSLDRLYGAVHESTGMVLHVTAPVPGIRYSEGVVVSGATTTTPIPGWVRTGGMYRPRGKDKFLQTELVTINHLRVRGAVPTIEYRTTHGNKEACVEDFIRTYEPIGGRWKTAWHRLLENCDD